MPIQQTTINNVLDAAFLSISLFEGKTSSGVQCLFFILQIS